MADHPDSVPPAATRGELKSILDAGPPRQRRLRLAAALAYALLATAGLGWILLRALPAHHPGPLRIAVVPFDNPGGTPGSEYLCQGVLDELTASVARVPGLLAVVRPRGDRISEPGKAQDVAAILEGTILHSRDRVRITARVSSAADATPLWTGTYERPAAAAFQVSQAIAASVGRVLRARPADWNPPPSPAANPLARDLYWRGCYARRQAAPDGLLQSVRYYQQAVAADPRFAAAHAALGEAYATIGFLDLQPPDAVIDKARTAARAAASLDPALAEPHALLGWIAFFHDWNWPQAELEFHRAAALNSNYARTHTWFALGLVSRARLREALAEIRIAQDLDPRSCLLSSEEGLVLYCARRYAEAGAWATEALERDPGFAPARQMLGACRTAEGNYPQAIREFEQALDLSERDSALLGRLGYAYARAGRVDRARELARELAERAPRGEAHYVHLALIYLGLEDRQRALACLEVGARHREPDLLFLRVDPLFDGLRGESRFTALLKRLGLTG